MTGGNAFTLGELRVKLNLQPSRQELWYDSEMKPNIGAKRQRILDEIVAKIINAASPKKIVLFGSASHGAMGAHSDFDLLIVVDNSIP